MGYYTFHTLSLRKKDGSDSDWQSEQYKKLQAKHSKQLEDETGFSSDEECKWYDREAEMKIYSKKYPHILFEINGSGEDTDDIWREYWLNGKVQHIDCKFIYDDFNPKQLKDVQSN